MDWAQILVIVLAVLFTVFLILAISLAILLVRITRQIKEVTASAERTVHAIEGSVTTFNRAALPFMMARKVIQIARAPRGKKRE